MTVRRGRCYTLLRPIRISLWLPSQVIASPVATHHFSDIVNQRKDVVTNLVPMSSLSTTCRNGRRPTRQARVSLRVFGGEVSSWSLPFTPVIRSPGQHSTLHAAVTFAQTV